MLCSHEPSEFADEDVPGLQPRIRMAKEVGGRLGECEVLQSALSPQQRPRPRALGEGGRLRAAPCPSPVCTYKCVYVCTWGHRPFERVIFCKCPGVFGMRGAVLRTPTLSQGDCILLYDEYRRAVEHSVLASMPPCFHSFRADGPLSGNIAASVPGWLPTYDRPATVPFATRK